MPHLSLSPERQALMEWVALKGKDCHVSKLEMEAFMSGFRVAAAQPRIMLSHRVAPPG